ncbi:4822_t:CDS:2, partial [Racocetra persica]
MALKYELEQWGAAVKAYDEQDFDLALDTFETIADSAKFHFNMGLIYATLGEHEEA